MSIYRRRDYKVEDYERLNREYHEKYKELTDGEHHEKYNVGMHRFWVDHYKYLIQVTEGHLKQIRDEEADRIRLRASRAHLTITLDDGKVHRFSINDDARIQVEWADDAGYKNGARLAEVHIRAWVDEVLGIYVWDGDTHKDYCSVILLPCGCEHGANGSLAPCEHLTNKERGSYL